MKILIKFIINKISLSLLLIVLIKLAIALIKPNIVFASSDRPAIHGMLMIGENTIYLSHLPMFHSPHDYQVIIEVSLNGKGNPTQIYKQDHQLSKENVYTLVPDSVFILPDKIQKVESFSATIYRGHFERNGTPIIKNVLVNIKKIVYFKKFAANDSAPSTYEAILFGNNSEYFMAHKILECPDFDQISSVEVRTKANLENSIFHLLTLQDQQNSYPLQEAKSYNYQNNAIAYDHGTIQVLKQIYLETDDLVCHM